MSGPWLISQRPVSFVVVIVSYLLQLNYGLSWFSMTDEQRAKGSFLPR